MTRDDWDHWKDRNAWWWNIVTLPFLVVAVLFLWLYTSYLRNCRIFGWKPWKFP